MGKTYGYGKSLISGEKPKIDSRLQSLEDINVGAYPEQESELRAIESESVLQDLMATDPVISGYDPEEIIIAYNDIAKFAPESAMQPMVLRSYLRKYLESSTNPNGKIMEGFDIGQLGTIENSKADSIRQDKKDIQDALNIEYKAPELTPIKK